MIMIDDEFLEKLRASIGDTPSDDGVSAMGHDMRPSHDADAAMDLGAIAVHKDNVAQEASLVQKSTGLKNNSSLQGAFMGTDTCNSADEYTLAFQKIVRLIGVRERCAQELRLRLKRDGFCEQATEASIERACECGLIDDLRFAEVYIRSKLSQGKGIDGIVRDLRQFNINIDDVEGWPDRFIEQIDNKSELDRAVEVLRHRPSHSKNPMRSAYQKLISRGFSSSVAQSAAHIYVQEHLVHTGNERL